MRTEIRETAPMAKGTNGSGREPGPVVTTDEIWAKFTATNPDGKTLAERFAASISSSPIFRFGEFMSLKPL
jgi:hypothetical protein